MGLQQTTYLHSEAVTVQVNSELPVFTQDKDFHLTRAFVPGALFTQGEWDGPVDRRIDINESDTCSIEQQGPDIIMGDSWQDTMPLNIVHLLYSATQRAHLERQAYSVHSACVAANDRGYLFVGHSGSGKTTSALTMVREHGFSWYSGNKTLLRFDGQTDEQGANALRATAGTLPTTIEASNAVTDVSIFNKDIRIPFVDRELRELQPEHLHTEAQVAIAGIFLVRVNNGAQKCSRLSSDGAAIPLLPFFYDYVNTDIHLPGGQLYSPEPIDGAHKNALNKRLRATLEHVPVFSVSGSFDYMANQIRKVADQNDA